MLYRKKMVNKCITYLLLFQLYSVPNKFLLKSLRNRVVPLLLELFEGSIRLQSYFYLVQPLVVPGFCSIFCFFKQHFSLKTAENIDIGWIINLGRGRGDEKMWRRKIFIEQFETSDSNFWAARYSTLVTITINWTKRLSQMHLIWCTECNRVAVVTWIYPQ